jgi:hypothetical protein
MNIKELVREFRLVGEYLGLHDEFWEKNAAKKIDEYLADMTIENDTPRWTLTKNGIPGDILALLFVAGKITETQFNNGNEYRQTKDKKEIAEYIKQQQNREYSEEELFEMKAAYGKGATVVNVFTGKKITL